MQFLASTSPQLIFMLEHSKHTRIRVVLGKKFKFFPAVNSDFYS